MKVVNSCKPFLSKVLLIMKSIHDIVTIAKKTESIASANLTTQLYPSINLPIVCENPKAFESNISNDTNRKKEIPYKEGILKDIGAHVGYTVLYWRGGYLSGGTNLDTPHGRYTRAVTNNIARGL